MAFDDSAPPSRFDRLASFLEHDPDNIALAADAIGAALDEDRVDEAQALLRSRPDAHAPDLRHLAGLIAIRQQRWDDAVQTYRALVEEGADAPPVRFNLAWSMTMIRDYEDALSWLDDATADALPQAAELKVRLLHELGMFDEAEEAARTLLVRHPDHPGLNAVVAVLALDIEDAELAARCARKAGDHPEALATLGTLALAEDDVGAAIPLFDAALARDPASPRAWVGRGLARLLTDDKSEAAVALDRGAGLFETHIGSWIAAGWAYVVAGDIATARARFETALALDDNFGESHGSLAVVDLLQGRLDEARRRLGIAQRLDRTSFSAALAATMIAAGEGDAARAAKIFERALATPIDGSGRTIAQSLARLGTGLG